MYEKLALPGDIARVAVAIELRDGTVGWRRAERIYEDA
jgi:hypothetical protein